MQTLGRRLLWKARYMTGLFKLCGYREGLEIEYGKVKQMPRVRDLDIKEMNSYAYTVLKMATPGDINNFVGFESSV